MLVASICGIQLLNSLSIVVENEHSRFGKGAALPDRERLTLVSIRRLAMRPMNNKGREPFVIH